MPEAIAPNLSLLMTSPALTLVALWALLWKGIALWKAVRRKQLVWYMAPPIINTVGILETVYIFLVAPRSTEA